ncbi:MAG: response regulator [Mesorhizobium sp.]|nr:MAG: response regulator [Mesorhizobium sp.]
MTARILVVDDIPANVRLLEVRLLAEYFEVLTAGNGPDAIETCENGKVDVVLLDVMMPGMDGPETLRRLADSPLTAAIPVAFITARTQTHEVERYLAMGAVGVIAKPFDPLALAGEVRRLLSGRSGPV